MAMADGASLIVLAPGVRVIRRRQADRCTHQEIRLCRHAKSPEYVNKMMDLKAKFKRSGASYPRLKRGQGLKITYCPGKLTRKEIESINFEYGNLAELHETLQSR